MTRVYVTRNAHDWFGVLVGLNAARAHPGIIERIRGTVRIAVRNGASDQPVTIPLYCAEEVEVVQAAIDHANTYFPPRVQERTE
jgi:hypothetical protein